MNTQPDKPAWTVEELRVELDRYEAELRTARSPRNTITSRIYPVDQFLDWIDEPYRPIGIMPRSSPDPRTSRDVVMMAGGGWRNSATTA